LIELLANRNFGWNIRLKESFFNNKNSGFIHYSFMEELCNLSQNRFYYLLLLIFSHYQN
jgi:hypothetical protein